MADRARILKDALTLPVEDRAPVAHELLRSLELDNGDVSAVRTDEIRRPIDEVEPGTAELHNLNTARARLEAVGRA